MDRVIVKKMLRSEDGVAMIEFALTLPVLMLIVLGMCDMARVLQKSQAVTNAAREGARTAVLPGYSTTDVQDRVTSYLDAAGVDSSIPATVTSQQVIPAGGGPTFTAMTVTVKSNYEFTLLKAISSTFGNTTFSTGTWTMTATSVMRTEAAGG